MSKGEKAMAAQNWNFDNVHSSIEFTVRHLLVSKVRGRFTRWSGAFQYDEKNPTVSSVDVQIDVASVDTHEPQRDAHLRSGDFFEVEKHPQITFKSTGVEAKSAGALALRGDLTIRGVTRPVVLDVELGGHVKDPWGNDRVGFSATTSIDRKDFGITFNQALDVGGLALGEKVDIAIEIEATRAVPAKDAAKEPKEGQAVAQ
jgi:polyisoprenoid-binding protein YceI